MKRFDTFVFCDWSASATPKRGRDSIWLCRSEGRARELVNPATRAEAAEIVRAWLARGKRTLIGWDFTLGLPAVSYAHFGFPHWRAYWEYLTAEIRDGARNENNRFDVARRLNERAGTGPFWGVPPRAADARLTIKKPPPDIRFPELREGDHALREMKRRPFSPWQLLGTGSVGSQSLVGIPVVQKLRLDPALRSRSRIWPFEDIEDADIVHCEAGPIAIAVDEGLHPVRDAAQMLSLAAQTNALLPSLEVSYSAVVRAEGWVLGVPKPRRLGA